MIISMAVTAAMTVTEIAITTMTNIFITTIIFVIKSNSNNITNRSIVIIISIIITTITGKKRKMTIMIIAMIPLIMIKHGIDNSYFFVIIKVALQSLFSLSLLPLVNINITISSSFSH